MKRLTDYKDEDAIELWADLLDPFVEIIGDKTITDMMRGGAAPIDVAKAILKDHRKDACQILLRIDDTPLDGLNILVRLVTILLDIENSKELQGFFGSAEQVKTGSGSFGSHTANTEDAEE